MKTVDEIYQEMTAKYAELTGTAVRDGCDMAVRLYAAAAQMESLYMYNDWVKSQCFPQTATGEYLDYHAQLHGLQRSIAHRSSGVISFYVQTSVDYDIWVPVGTVCVTASGVRFETTEIGSIPAGGTYCRCQAQSIDMGTVCNATAGSIVYMPQPPVGISSCLNVEAFTGGSDDEDDESLRSRILISLNSLSNIANAAYYEQAAMSVGGVSAVKVLPKNRGVGTVDVVVSGEDGMPSEMLIAEVADVIDASREICVDVSVYAPTDVTVDVQINIDIEDGYGFDAVADEVRSAVSGYFNSTLLGCDVLMAKLGNVIFDVDGVRNYKLILPADDVQIADDQLPRLGTLTVSSWS